MKNLATFFAAVSILIVVALGCSMSTANLSSLKTSKEKDGADATSFKSGDTLYGKAQVSNNPGKVKVNLYLTGSKGETLKGSEVTLNIDGDASANYTLPLVAAIEPGSYTLHADMLNEAGEKKDSKTANITIAE